MSFSQSNSHFSIIISFYLTYQTGADIVIDLIIALSAGLVALAIYIIDKFNGEVHHLLSQLQITQEQVQQIAEALKIWGILQ